MAVARVQTKAATSDSTQMTSIAVTFTAPVGSGRLVMGIVHFGTPIGTEAISQIDDNQGNVYTVVRTINDATNFSKTATFYLKNITNAPQTVTAHFTAVCNFRAIAVHEVSGADTTAPLDQEVGQLQAAQNTDPDAVTSTAVTPVANGEYIFAALALTDQEATPPIVSAGTGYTVREEVGSSTTANIVTEDQIQATAASIAGTFTQLVNGPHAVFIMTFKAAAAGVFSLACAGGSYTLTGTALTGTHTATNTWLRVRR